MIKKFIFSCTVVIISAVLCGGGVPETLISGNDIIEEGVYIEDMDMSGKTVREALAETEAYVHRLSRKMIHVRNEEFDFSLMFAEAGLEANIAEAVQCAAQIGQSGHFFRDLKERWDARIGGVHISLTFDFDWAAIKAFYEEKAELVNRAPKAASIVRENGEFIVEESYNGRTLNIDKIVDNIATVLTADWNRQEFSVLLTIEETLPEHTTEELSVIQDLLGAYETSFAGSNNNRISNIKNGVGKLENVILYPGEEFSFLLLMKPFTYENGYHMAGTYVNGRNVDGMGGGICQVSSTLYNAVLRAELTVTQRSNHMMTVGYVPLGADATIADPTVDFCFRNDLNAPILIEAYTSGTAVYVNIYGQETRPGNRSVTFVTVTEETIRPGADIVTYDSSLPSSYKQITQTAHIGYVAAFYKNVYIDNQLVEQTLINRSRYGAFPAYVLQGTAEN